LDLIKNDDKENLVTFGEIYEKIGLIIQQHGRFIQANKVLSKAYRRFRNAYATENHVRIALIQARIGLNNAE